MSYKIDDIPTRPVGRPAEGAESRSERINLRIEPYIGERLTIVCRRFGITKSEALRQGLLMYLAEAERLMKGG